MLNELITGIEKTPNGWEVKEENRFCENAENASVSFKDGSLIIRFEDKTYDYGNEQEIQNGIRQNEYKISDVNSTAILKPAEIEGKNASDAEWESYVVYNHLAYISDSDNVFTAAYIIGDIDKSSVLSIAIEPEINIFPVEKIGFSAFPDCGFLTQAVIPASIREIGNNAFENCAYLTSITIPIGVERMSYDVFKGCTNLTTINCAAASKPAGWDDNWLGNCGAQVNWGVN